MTNINEVSKDDVMGEEDVFYELRIDIRIPFIPSYSSRRTIVGNTEEEVRDNLNRHITISSMSKNDHKVEVTYDIISYAEKRVRPLEWKK